MNFKKIVDKLIEDNKTISTMESCTGGGVANAITNIKAYKEKNPETFEKNRSGTEYKKVYRTGNNGETTFFVYHDTELPEWNEEDLKYIDATVNLLILCYARAHLIDVLENMILFDPMSGIPSIEGFFKFARKMLTKGELNQYNSYYCGFVYCKRIVGCSPTILTVDADTRLIS